MAESTIHAARAARTVPPMLVQKQCFQKWYIHMGLRPAADPKEIPFMSGSIECVDVSLICFQATAEKCLSTRNSPKLLT